MCTSESAQRHVCCVSCCKVHPHSQNYTVIDGKDAETATNPESTRVSQLSYTDFAVPYTRGFTQITTSDHVADRARLDLETYN